jgi:SAM-dependent methyltransferase
VREYDLIAEWYASERIDQTGVPETLALVGMLPARARVLDIGCGNGLPITRALVAADVRAVGIDSAPNMLARFRVNLPGTPVVRGSAQRLPFADGTFDGAVAWGVMFHLPQVEETKVIASVARVLKPGGWLLFTAGYPTETSDNPDHVGEMNGVQFHYYSFTRDGYRRVLADHGLLLVDFHTDRGANGYYLAKQSV